jgi:hypothetical protein
MGNDMTEVTGIGNVIHGCDDGRYRRHGSDVLGPSVVRHDMRDAEKEDVVVSWLYAGEDVEQPGLLNIFLHEICRASTPAHSSRKLTLRRSCEWSRCEVGTLVYNPFILLFLCTTSARSEKISSSSHAASMAHA